MNRRDFLSPAIAITLLGPLPVAWSKTYLSPEQALGILFPGEKPTPVPLTLTKEQAAVIQKKSRNRVRNRTMKIWRMQKGGWFILDTVIGKHENIDLAVGLDAAGGVVGIEVLVYRETYGHQIMNPKWREQFTGKTHAEHLKLDEQIKNISGATLSCRHVTDGINRLTQTWEQVLRHLADPRK